MAKQPNPVSAGSTKPAPPPAPPSGAYQGEETLMIYLADLGEEEDPVDRAIRVLNEALELDQAAINELFDYQVSVNYMLAEHPTIQVGAYRNGYRLRAIGLINGLFGVDEDDWGFIAMECGDDGRIIKFARTPDRG